MVIRRAEREGDRWSGDICFPGGLAHPQDTDPLHTAVRETHEETNLVLGAPLGALDDVLAIRPHGLRPMVIVPHVFWVTTQRPVPDGREVQTCHWLPLDALLDPSHRDRMVRRIGPIPARFDRIRFQGLTVWGLTLTMIDNLVARIRP
jgi:8-oxo-dGTP pyrophosphatase MutT (NUDIX family)